MKELADLVHRHAGAWPRRKPELEEPSKPPLVGIDLAERQNGLVVEGRFEANAKPGIAKVGGDRQPGLSRLLFELVSLGLCDENLDRPLLVAKFFGQYVGHFGILAAVAAGPQGPS